MTHIIDTARVLDKNSLVSELESFYYNRIKVKKESKAAGKVFFISSWLSGVLALAGFTMIFVASEHMELLLLTSCLILMVSHFLKVKGEIACWLNENPVKGVNIFNFRIKRVKVDRKKLIDEFLITEEHNYYNRTDIGVILKVMDKRIIDQRWLGYIWIGLLAIYVVMIYSEVSLLQTSLVTLMEFHVDVRGVIASLFLSIFVMDLIRIHKVRSREMLYLRTLLNGVRRGLKKGFIIR